ncbi:response regulator transcription factor [Algibacter amylolyticus]|uniref:Response regulator transcription factor n=1 Tax=Algibacter amylolyticus TaxID=1608400 RepID=A0A5M7BEX5_9FLAO|nr:LytTR family DNA-binding domain-containing protein [Algibacter amylolyticus]KAA5827899.1 response regulator transcription factor [Algibacter amylolyticus]MBB5267131.1 DNA-binding LytR/AlgR family response regulator [Algibacter amylolyticus]TSJ82144.1 response regulator transcription factor [Algibacter amylolyticus]
MKCVIIEDEIPAQNILKNFIAKMPSLELLATFKAAIEANTYLNTQSVDVVFLDINLPDMSGLDFIKTIQNPPAIIMTTAYSEYAVTSFELDTIVDYLVKPFSFDRFLKAVNKAKDKLEVAQVTNNVNEETIFLNVDKTLHKIVISKILYIESQRNYITVVTETQRLSYIDALKNWNTKLPKNDFIQVHKSFIINSKFIDKISGNTLYISANKIPIGRTYKQDLLRVLGV